jgi:hypothetical protein
MKIKRSIPTAAQRDARRAQNLAEHYRLERDELLRIAKELNQTKKPLDVHWQIAAERAERRLKRLKVENRLLNYRIILRKIIGYLTEIWHLARGLKEAEKWDSKR